ncbi:hypothetical protein QFZ50_002211 [Arthrobacter agilis]|nr:hypothetical protein [Arthrobacter agilis]
MSASASYPVVPSVAQSPGSSSPGSRIFSTRTYAPPVRVRRSSRVALGIGEAVGVVDPQAVHEALVEPSPHFAMALLEHPRHLDAQAREGVHAEEAPVVEFAVGAAPVHELIVLAGMHLGTRVTRMRRTLGDRVPVVVVAQLTVDDRELVQFVVAVAQDGDADPPAVGVPVDVERLRHARGTALPEELPPPGVVGGRLDAHVVGHDVDEHPHARGPGGLAERSEAAGTAAVGVDGGGVGHVVAVAGPLLRRQDR